MVDKWHLSSSSQLAAALIKDWIRGCGRPGCEDICGRNSDARKKGWFFNSMILAWHSLSKPVIFRFPSLKRFLYVSFKPYWHWNVSTALLLPYAWCAKEFLTMQTIWETPAREQESLLIKGVIASGFFSAWKLFLISRTFRAYSNRVCWNPAHVAKKGFSLSRQCLMARIAASESI